MPSPSAARQTSYSSARRFSQPVALVTSGRKQLARSASASSAASWLDSGPSSPKSPGGRVQHATARPVLRRQPSSPTLQSQRKSLAKAKLLKSGDAATRASAAESIGELGHAGAPHAAALAALLQDSSREVRIAAVDALAKIGGTTAAAHAAAIARLLQDDCPVVQTAAAQALGTMGTAGSAFVVPMAELLKDGRLTVRYLALESLSFLQGAGAAMEPHVLVVTDMLRAEEWRARKAAVEAFGKMKVDVVLTRLDKILPLLDDKSAVVRCEAVRTLGKLGQQVVQRYDDCIARLLQDSDQYVRRAALSALGDAGPAHVAAIVETLKDVDEHEVEARYPATDALRDFGKVAVAPLIKLLDNGSLGAARLACKCLCQIKEVPYLLAHDNLLVRRFALDALAIMSEIAVDHVEAIFEFVHDADEEIRGLAVKVLACLGEASAGLSMELLTHKEAFVRQAACEILGRIVGQTPNGVESSCGQGSWRPLETAVGAIASAVSALLWDSASSVRANAGRALENMGADGARFLEVARAQARIDKACAKSFEHDLLKMAAEHLNWSISTGSGGVVVWVHGKENIMERLPGLRPGEYLSHVPALGTLTLKVPLAALLQSAGVDFWPRSWCVPEVQAESCWVGLRRGRPMLGQSVESVCHEAFSAGSKTYIVKPSAGSQGKGIALVRSGEELVSALDGLKTPSAIVQEYIDRPLLLSGHKWDARVYALLMPEVTGAAEELRFNCFLAHEGLVRVCVEPYEQADARNLHRSTSHLTNYSLSKISEKFVHSEDPNNPDHGSKRKLSRVLQRLELGADAPRTERMNDGDGNEGVFHGPFDTKGRAHGLGILRLDNGQMFIGEFIHGDLHRGTLYENGSPVSTMDSYKRTVMVDELLVQDFPFKLASELPMARPRIDDGASDGFRAQDFWCHVATMVRQTADCLAAPLLATALDSAMWDGSAEMVAAIRNMMPRCFHIIGLDVILDEGGKPWLLEINSAPSLDIAEVIPRDDLRHQTLAEQNQMFAAATHELRGPKLGRLCRCSALPCPHVHERSPVDVAVKLPVLADAFKIIGRARSDYEGGPDAWANGTLYEVV